MADGTTREHATYNGEIIKQADANLLAYPLKVVTDEATIRKDLAYYEARMDPKGPAMGAAVLSLLHARLGNPDKALELFHQELPPQRGAALRGDRRNGRGHQSVLCHGGRRHAAGAAKRLRRPRRHPGRAWYN
jgi:hypothetical protein